MLKISGSFILFQDVSTEKQFVQRSEASTSPLTSIHTEWALTRVSHLLSHLEVSVFWRGSISAVREILQIRSVLVKVKSALRLRMKQKTSSFGSCFATLCKFLAILFVCVYHQI